MHGVRPLTDYERSSLTRWVTHTGESPVALMPISTYDIGELGGFVAMDIDKVVGGGLTYAIEHDTCEIVTLDAHIVYRAAVELAPPLLDTMKPSDVQLACIPLTLLTTNDNLRAQ